MKKRSISCTWIEYQATEDVPADLQELLVAARKALENSYSPYSNFKVGAAAKLQNGQMVIGANMENASFPLCICAEKACIAQCESRFPGIAVEVIAITAKGAKDAIRHPISPCGSCRQVLMEKEQRQGQALQIVLFGEQGPVWSFSSAEHLLPHPFDGKNL